MSDQPQRRRILVWDLPVRVLHAALAGGITVALVLGFAVEEDHPLFAYHILAGMFAGGALLLRVVWGFTGAGPARFARWPLAPSELRRHLQGFFSGATDDSNPGHNPPASWVMLGILVLAAAAVATGLTGGDDLHDGLAVALSIAIGLHLAGLVLHLMITGENLAPAMIDGRKLGPRPASMGRHHALAGATFAVLLGLWAGVLWRSYDAQAGQVRLPFGLPAIGTKGEAGGDHDDDDHDHD